MSKNKSIKDSQLNYLINLLKTNYIENISLTDNILSITKDGTITTYDLTINEATDTVSGLMSFEDKIKLEGIEAGAEVNQNAFAAIKFDEMAIVAETKNDIMHITSGNNVIFDVSDDGESIVIKATDTTYNVVTESEAGLMSPEDKIKVNDAVLLVPQDLNENQQSQVRKNINAINSWDELQNKPFGRERTETVVLDEIIVSGTTGYIPFTIGTDIPDFENVEHIVICDGIEYRCMPFYDKSDDGTPVPILGDSGPWCRLSDPRYPFGISAYHNQIYVDGGGYHTIKILKNVSETLTLIDDEFISSNIARVSDIPSEVSESKAGLMLSEDKIKLDTIEEGATKTIIDSSLSDTSENPVQNKVIKSELNSIQEAIPTLGYITNDIIDSICNGNVQSASEVLF